MEYILEIKKLDHNGRGIGSLNNKIIFVEQALVGDVVKVKITCEKKHYLEGKIVEFIEKSKKRIESRCQYFNECGGCDLLHMPYEEQLKFKQDKVNDIMKRYSGITDIESKIKPIVKSDKILQYRNKVTLQVKEKIGFYKRKSYELVSIDKCLLITDKMNDLLTKIKEKIDLESVLQIVIKDMGNNQLMLTFYLRNKDNIDSIINKFQREVDSLNFYVNNIYYKAINKSNIIAKLDNFQFLVSPSSFFQVNLGQTVKLYNKIYQYCQLQGTEQVIDLYCGTGTIGIYLSQHCSKVLGIEINEDSIKDATENKKINSISNIDFMVGDTKDLIKKIQIKPDIIVVDPPRSGLHDSVINDIMKLNPKKIIYVSCDPLTLARDLKKLDTNYEVVELTPIDMFPNTYHVENIVLMQLRD